MIWVMMWELSKRVLVGVIHVVSRTYCDDSVGCKFVARSPSLVKQQYDLEICMSKIQRRDRLFWGSSL